MTAKENKCQTQKIIIIQNFPVLTGCWTSPASVVKYVTWANILYITVLMAKPLLASRVEVMGP